MTSREEQARHLECLDAEIAETCARLREIRHDRDITAAWIEGYDARREEEAWPDDRPSEGAIRGAELLATLPTPATPPVPERKRHDVQGAVMAYLRDPWRTLASAGVTENDITADTGLPAESVHVFLLRAVRSGRLVREGDLYRLPPNMTPEPVKAKAETGPTVEGAVGSANVSEGVTAERAPAGETGGEAEGHEQLPEADDPPADPAEIEDAILDRMEEAAQ